MGGARRSIKLIKRLAVGFFILSFGGVMLTCLLPASASAAAPDYCKGSLLGLPTWYEYLDIGPRKNKDDQVLVKDDTKSSDDPENQVEPCAVVGPATADKSLDWQKAVPRVIAAIIQILLRLAGLVAVGFTIYGGFSYILSQGEPDATKKAKGTIIGASIGLIITLFAATIVGFVGSILWT